MEDARRRRLLAAAGGLLVAATAAVTVPAIANAAPAAPSCTATPSAPRVDGQLRLALTVTVTCTGPVGQLAVDSEILRVDSGSAARTVVRGSEQFVGGTTAPVTVTSDFRCQDPSDPYGQDVPFIGDVRISYSTASDDPRSPGGGEVRVATARSGQATLRCGFPAT